MTDHANIARYLLGEAETIPYPDYEAKDGHKADAIAIAQAHATLALVEQQRIANLIALCGSEYPALNEHVAADASKVLTEYEPDAWRTVVALMGDAGRDRYWTGRLVSVEPACCPPNTTHTKGTEA